MINLNRLVLKYIKMSLMWALNASIIRVLQSSYMVYTFLMNIVGT